MKRTDAPDLRPEPIPDEPTPEQLRELGVWVDCIETAHHQRFAPTTGTQDSREYSAADLPTLYLETTIVSYATSRLSRDSHVARHQLITRHWWHNCRSQHVSYTSELVHDEAKRGDPHAAARRTEMLSRLPRVHRTTQSDQIAARIFAMCKLPARAEADAHHVAMAALNGLHIVLTWNCSHLANENMIPIMRRACAAYGYAAPLIYTPEQLIGVCAYG